MPEGLSIHNPATLAFSVVVPIYNSSKSLGELCERLTRVFDAIGEEYEILLVDDGSRDNSWTLMKEIRKTYPQIKLLQHTRNFGQHNTILSGIAHTRGELIITMDDDLQHPPEEIPKLVTAIREDESMDAVVGSYETKQHHPIRNLATKTIERLTCYMLQTDPNLKLTSFRVMRRTIARHLLEYRNFSPRIGLLLMQITTQVKNVQVEHHPRKYDQSGYSLRRLVSNGLDNILGNSALPLQLVSFLGLGCFVLSTILGIYYFCEYLFGGIAIQGWTTLVLLLLFFFGVSLFAMGIIGEYLIRILFEVRRMPTGTIRTKELD